MQLNNAAMQISWDHMNRKETEEAKSLYIQSKRQFRLIVNVKDEPVHNFKDVVDLGYFKIKEVQLAPNQVAMRILNEKGDETVIWDVNDPDEIQEAANRFQGYLDKGWRAFAIDPNGKKHRRIRQFNATLEEISFEEGSINKLKDFVKSFRKIEVTPKTRAG